MKKQDQLSLLPNLSYHGILDQLQDGIFITDWERRTLYWNKTAELLTGFRAEEVLGLHCHDKIQLSAGEEGQNPLCDDETCPILQAMRNDVGGTYPRLVFIHTKCGFFLPVLLNVGPIHDSSGKVVGGICQFQDRGEEYQQRKLAVEIQKRMVTLQSLDRGRVTVETLYKPVEEIGGDFLEAFFLDDGSLIATVADATGHGISASLFSMIYKTLLHSAFSSCRNPGEILRSINRGFSQTVKIDGFYLTGSIVRFDPESLCGNYASAGNPAGLIFAPSKAGYRLRQELKIKSAMLGVSEEAEYPEIPFQLEQGEFLLLLSDGIYELQCRDDKPFGSEGVERFLQSYRGSSPLGDLYQELLKASKFVRPLDDISMLKMQCRAQ